MRIIFSVYKEDRDSEEKIFLYRECVTTDLRIEEIDKVLNLYDGFHYNLIVGQTLSFWDIYCFFDFHDEIIEKIKRLPRTEYQLQPNKEFTALLIEDFDPGIVGNPQLPNFEDTFLFEMKRYECGANSAEALVYWILDNPIMINILYDTCKFAIKSLFMRLKSGTFSYEKRSTIYFRPKVFRKDFLNIVNIKADEYQILGIKKTRKGDLAVIVRTISDETYKVKCTAKGRILEFKKE